MPGKSADAQPFPYETIPTCSQYCPVHWNIGPPESPIENNYLTVIRKKEFTLTRIYNEKKLIKYCSKRLIEYLPFPPSNKPAQNCNSVVLIEFKHIGS